MIGSTLIEQKAAALFLFSSIVTGHQGNIIKQTSLNVGKRFSVQSSRVSMDENRRSGFYPYEPIIWSQRPYKTGHI